MVRAVFKKRVSRKTRLKFWVVVWETPDTPQEKREIKQKKKTIFNIWNLLPHILQGSN